MLNRAVAGLQGRIHMILDSRAQVVLTPQFLTQSSCESEAWHAVSACDGMVHEPALTHANCCAGPFLIWTMLLFITSLVCPAQPMHNHAMLCTYAMGKLADPTSAACSNPSKSVGMQTFYTSEFIISSDASTKESFVFDPSKR